jgi:hypothetical protein
MGRGGLDMRLRSYRPLAGWARSMPAVGLFAFVLCDLSWRPAVVASSVYDKGATIGVYGKYKLRLRRLHFMLILFCSVDDGSREVEVQDVAQSGWNHKEIGRHPPKKHGSSFAAPRG